MVQISLSRSEKLELVIKSQIMVECPLTQFNKIFYKTILHVTSLIDIIIIVRVYIYISIFILYIVVYSIMRASTVEHIN